jgi:hypothetical protein
MPGTQAKLPILYICPYCRSGRFTAEDGWDVAVKHIRDKHLNRGEKRVRRRSAPSRTSFGLLDSLDDSLLAEETLS